MSEGGDEPKDRPRWAADDPTAMWDEGAVREKGLEHGQEPADAQTLAGSSPERTPAGTSGVAPTPSSLSWPLTIGLAVAVAAIVYVAVRFFLR